MVRVEGFIDHFENDLAFLSKLDYTFSIVSRRDLPLNARKGDFIVKANDKYPFAINRKITELSHREICRLNDHYFG